VAVAIAHGFTAKVNAVRLSVVTAMAGGDPGAGFEQLAADAAHLGPSVILDERSAERADVPAASRYAPGMGIFFMFTAMVLTLARSEQQAQLYMSVATLGMAMLGGNFIDVERGPELLRRLSLITPNGWALRAFRDLNVDRGGLGSITTHVSSILAFALVTFAIAAVRSRRLVRL
jgi:hypothetical protein